MKPKSSDGQRRPSRHHLDRRADRLIEDGSTGQPDDLLSTVKLAKWLGTSTQWLEIGRSRGYGPTFIRISPRMVRYRRKDVLKWLAERSYHSTGEYPKCAEQLVTAREEEVEPET